MVLLLLRLNILGFVISHGFVCLHIQDMADNGR